MRRNSSITSCHPFVLAFSSWLNGMAKGAEDHGVGILYCCAHPSVHMFGATVQAAYAVRASPDYVSAVSLEPSALSMVERFVRGTCLAL